MGHTPEDRTMSELWSVFDDVRNAADRGDQAHLAALADEAWSHIISLEQVLYIPTVGWEQQAEQAWRAIHRFALEAHEPARTLDWDACRAELHEHYPALRGGR